MPEPRWDLIVVGAGPAGCAAAAAALQTNPDARVLLLDRQSFPRDKPCGDGIAAEALDVLAELGFDIDVICAGFAPVIRLRITAPGGSVADRRLHRAVRVIPRLVLDARVLSDVVSRGAVFRRHTVRSVVVRDSEVVVDGELRARVVIGADGAESVLRPSRAAAGPIALAIRGYAPEVAGQDGAQVITMSRRNWPAYAWSFPIGGGRANVGYGELMVGHPLNRAAMLTRLHELLPGLDAPTGLRAHRLPLSPGRPRVDDGRLLLVGDALSLINPISGEGIFYAVRSGGLAGRASAAGAGAGSRYRTLLSAALSRHLRTTDVLNRLLRMPRLIDAGVRAAAAHQQPFDDLVRLSLADGGFTRQLATGVAGRLLG